jgi:hypothetical protein
VQLAAVDTERPHRIQHHLGQHRRPIGVEQPVEAAPEAVVVEQRQLA